MPRSGPPLMCTTWKQVNLTAVRLSNSCRPTGARTCATTRCASVLIRYLRHNVTAFRYELIDTSFSDANPSKRLIRLKRSAKTADTPVRFIQAAGERRVAAVQIAATCRRCIVARMWAAAMS